MHSKVFRNWSKNLVKVEKFDNNRLKQYQNDNNSRNEAKKYYLWNSCNSHRKYTIRKHKFATYIIQISQSNHHWTFPQIFLSLFNLGHLNWGKPSIQIGKKKSIFIWFMYFHLVNIQLRPFAELLHVWKLSFLGIHFILLFSFLCAFENNHHAFLAHPE